MRQQTTQRLLAAAFAALLLTTAHLGAQRGADPDVRFRDALHKQQVEGDLNGAMEIYREIAASGRASQALKARALLQLATSLETQGQQAESVYQRIVREFADQPAASQARTKLAALKPPTPAALTLTQIRFGAGVQNVVATDGQRAVYWDTDRTKLFIGDIAGKARTQVFTTTEQRRPRVEASRDLSMLFLYFVPTEQNPVTSYAIIRTDGSGGYREVNLSEETPGVFPLYGVSWSFDNRYVVLCKMEQDRIVRPRKLSLADGKFEDLLPGHPVSIAYAVLSRDGRTLAFQELGWPGAVYTKPLQGGNPEIVAQGGAVADWTLDDRHLVFGALEKEVFSLYTVPVRDGRLAGERTFVRSVGTNNISRPVTSGNSLIFEENVANREEPRVYHASLDAENRLSDWRAVKTIGRVRTYPVFSPDRTRIAYLLRSRENNNTTVRVHTLATGDDRELYRSDRLIVNCIWATQPPVLYCGQLSQAEGKTAILSIDETTGRAETLTSLSGIRTMEALTPDERTIHMFNLTGPTPWPRWQIGADQETPGLQQAPYSSRDDRWTMRPGADNANRRNIQIRPAAAGDEAWEHLVYLRKQAPDARGVIPTRFTPDGNWLVYHDLDDEDKDALFRVSSSGGERQRLGGYPTNSPNSYLNISKDGRQFLVEAVPDNRTSVEGLQVEHWQLQNFLTTTTATSSK